MRKVVLKKVCGNCEWAEIPTTHAHPWYPWCMIDGHTLDSPGDEACALHTFHMEWKAHFDGKSAIQQDLKRQIEQMEKSANKAKENGVEVG